MSSLELRVQFCLLVCCTYPSSSTVNKEKNLKDQRTSFRVDTKETQQINWRRRHWDFQHRNTSCRRSYPIRRGFLLFFFFFFTSIVSTMAETTELIKLLADQIQVQRQQMEQHSPQHRAEMEQQAQHHREEMHNLLKILDVQKHGTGEDDSSTHHPQLSTATIPKFAAFDSSSELWPDYWSRFCAFVVASAVPEQRQAQVFLTNQTAAAYKHWLIWLLNKLRPRTSTN